MAKKTLFTTITPIPAGVSRETVLETLHDHLEMIDLNPSHESRVQIKPPPEASPEEYHCVWYSITDKVNYLPAGLYSGKVSFKACFHDLANGMQTHCYAPMGLDIKQKWTIGGSLPGEPVQPVELGIGAPITGLYLREDVELKCNILMTKFVKKTLKDALATLVSRLVVKSQLQEAASSNRRLTYNPGASAYDPNGAGTATWQSGSSVHSAGGPSGALSPPMSPQPSPGMLHSPGLMSPPLSPPYPGAPQHLQPGGLGIDYGHQQWQQQTSNVSWKEQQDRASYQAWLEAQHEKGKRLSPQQPLQQQLSQSTHMAVELDSGSRYNSSNPNSPGLAGYGPVELPPAELPASSSFH